MSQSTVNVLLNDTVISGGLIKFTSGIKSIGEQPLSSVILIG